MSQQVVPNDGWYLSNPREGGWIPIVAWLVSDGGDRVELWPIAMTPGSAVPTAVSRADVEERGYVLMQEDGS